MGILLPGMHYQQPTTTRHSKAEAAQIRAKHNLTRITLPSTRRNSISSNKSKL